MKKLGFAILLLLLCSILLYRQSGLEQLIRPSKPVAERNTLNFYLQDLVVHSFNERGELTHKLAATSASQLAGAERIDMIQPNLEFGLNEVPWQAKADTGFTKGNMAEITLAGAVKLLRHEGAFDVSTETLVFDSAHELAYTTDDVLILAKGSETRSTGVSIDLKNEIVQLKQNVKTHYVPKPNQSRRTPDRR